MFGRFSPEVFTIIEGLGLSTATAAALQGAAPDAVTDKHMRVTSVPAAKPMSCSGIDALPISDCRFSDAVGWVGLQQPQ